MTAAEDTMRGDGLLDVQRPDGREAERVQPGSNAKICCRPDASLRQLLREIPSKVGQSRELSHTRLLMAARWMPSRMISASGTPRRAAIRHSGSAWLLLSTLLN
jgi:hypothetical protein